MTSSEPVHVVLVTAPDAETGARLARDLVAHGLAACVNLVPGVRSIYRWQGALQEDAEILLIAKTRAGLVPALAERLRALHSLRAARGDRVAGAGGQRALSRWVRAAAEARP